MALILSHIQVMLARVEYTMDTFMTPQVTTRRRTPAGWRRSSSWRRPSETVCTTEVRRSELWTPHLKETHLTLLPAHSLRTRPWPTRSSVSWLLWWCQRRGDEVEEEEAVRQLNSGSGFGGRRNRLRRIALNKAIKRRRFTTFCSFLSLLLMSQREPILSLYILLKPEDMQLLSFDCRTNFGGKSEKKISLPF